MHLIMAFQLYGIAIDTAAANLGQSQLILAISIELAGHATPFRDPLSPSSILAGAVDAGGCT